MLVVARGNYAPCASSRSSPSLEGASMVDERPRVELYVRSLAPTNGRTEQERTVDRLRSLDDRGEIKGVDIRLCGDCVCPSLNTATTDVGELLLDRYSTFQGWAEQAGRELTGFERQQTESLLTGTTVTGISFPKLTLAEFRGGSLTFVAPSADGDSHTSVSERVDTY